MVEVLVIVAIIEATPLGDFLDYVSYCALLSFGALIKALHIVLIHFRVGVVCHGAFNSIIFVTPCSSTIILGFMYRVVFILFFRRVFIEATDSLRTLVEAESKRWCVVNYFEVFLANMHEIANWVHIAINEGGKNA